MVIETISIGDTKNWDTIRAKLNRNFAALAAGQAGFDAALPSVTDQPEGRLFVVTGTQELYQLQSGAWQLLA